MTELNPENKKSFWLGLGQRLGIKFEDVAQDEVSPEPVAEVAPEAVEADKLKEENEALKAEKDALASKVAELETKLSEITTEAEELKTKATEAEELKTKLSEVETKLAEIQAEPADKKIKLEAQPAEPTKADLFLQSVKRGF